MILDSVSTKELKNKMAISVILMILKGSSQLHQQSQMQG